MAFICYLVFTNASDHLNVLPIACRGHHHSLPSLHAALYFWEPIQRRDTRLLWVEDRESRQPIRVKPGHDVKKKQWLNGFVLAPGQDLHEAFPLSMWFMINTLFHHEHLRSSMKISKWVFIPLEQGLLLESPRQVYPVPNTTWHIRRTTPHSTHRNWLSVPQSLDGYHRWIHCVQYSSVITEFLQLDLRF